MAPALQLCGVTHSFGTRTALDEFSLVVRPGEVVAMIGFNGAGKTTAMRILAGRLRPAAGTAEILGHGPARLPEQVARGFGHLVDAPFALPGLTVAENIRTAARLHGLRPAEARQAAEDAVARLALTPWAGTRSHALSQGNRQRLGIAAATVHRPAALVLDEPTSALDPRGVVAVRDLIRDLADQDSAILVSSHHLDEVSRVADRIVVVHAGRPIGDLEPGGTDLERRFFAMVHDADARRDPEDRPDTAAHAGGVRP